MNDRAMRMGKGLNLTVFLRFPAASPKGEGNWLVYRRILP